MPAPFWFGSPDFSELDDLTAPGYQSGGGGGSASGGGSYFQPDPLSSVTPGTLFAPNETGGNTSTPADLGSSPQSAIGEAFDDAVPTLVGGAVNQATGYLYNQAADLVAPVIDNVMNSVTGVLNPVADTVQNLFTNVGSEATANIGTAALATPANTASIATNALANSAASGGLPALAANALGSDVIGSLWNGATPTLAENALGLSAGTAASESAGNAAVAAAPESFLAKASTFLGPLFNAYSTIKALDGRSTAAKGVAGSAAAAGTYFGAALGPVGAVLGGAVGSLAGSLIAGKHDPRYEVFMNSSGQLVDTSGNNLGNIGELPKADQYYTGPKGERHLGMKAVPGVNRDGHGVLIDSEGNFWTGEQGSGLSKWDTGVQYGPDAIPKGHFQQLNGLSQTSGGEKFQQFDFDGYIEHVGSGGDPADFNTTDTGVNGVSGSGNFASNSRRGQSLSPEDRATPFEGAAYQALTTGYAQDAPTLQQTPPSQELTLGSPARPGGGQRLATTPSSPPPAAPAPTPPPTPPTPAAPPAPAPTTGFKTNTRIGRSLNASQTAMLPSSAQPTGLAVPSQQAMATALDSGPFGFSYTKLRAR